MKTLQQPSSEDLKALLKQHGVTRQQAADMLYVSIHTMDSWCTPSSSKKHNDMPLSSWELLLLKLSAHPFKKVVDR
jgi:hypothetical protein